MIRFFHLWVYVKDEPLWISANADMKLHQQIVKVILGFEPFQLWQHDIDSG